MSKIMEKLTKFLEEHFVPYAAKVANQKHLQAVRDGLVMSMSLIIIGSMPPSWLSVDLNEPSVVTEWTTALSSFE